MKRKTLLFIAAVSAMLLSSVLLASLPTSARGKISHFTANVMAPLKIDLSNQDEVNGFKQQLQNVKSKGVDAVSIDVWWGMVEGAGDQKFDWSYYDQVFKMITDANLQVQAIMSFHKCGGNVGDTVYIPIPTWIWKVAGPGGQYVNELHNPGNDEVVALWAQNSDDVNNQYIEFMDEFEKHFASYADKLQSINISCGPAGECRYPSYDVYEIDGKSYGRGYPTRGYLYCYSDQAVTAFQKAMKTKYGSVSKLNAAWGTGLSSFSYVNPPSNGDSFFNIKDPKAYVNSQYGRDFIDWYSAEMADHGKNMLDCAIKAFDREFVNIELEIKIPGVHWTMGDPNMPRSAEVCAGLLNSSFKTNVNKDGCGPGYSTLLGAVQSIKGKAGKHDPMVYFTCLEMSNENYSPAYSMASALVFGVGEQAHDTGLMIKGENALAPNNGSTWNTGGFWWNINNAISWCWYDGITILRVGDVAYGDQLNNFAKLINNHKKNGL